MAFQFRAEEDSITLCDTLQHFIIDFRLSVNLRSKTMRKAQSDKNGKVYIGARVPEKLKRKLASRARQENRSEASMLTVILTKELATEELL